MPIAFTLHQITGLLDKKAESILSHDYGISFAWFQLLNVLSTDGPATQHQVASRLHVSDAAVSKLLDRMSSSGLVSVAADTNRQRRQIVSLTDTGKELVVSATDKLDRLLRTEFQDAYVNITWYEQMSNALLQKLTTKI